MDVRAGDGGSPAQEGEYTAEPEAGGGGRRYAVVVCGFASLGGMFFGFDQGVTGGVLVMDSFLGDFCEGVYDSNATCSAQGRQPDAWLTFATLFSFTYYIGCIAGALCGQWLMDARGRRAAIFAASVLFCIGTAWVCATPAGGNAAVLGGRVVVGVGVGMSSFSLPIYCAEMAPKELRGGLSGFMQFTVVAGLLAAGVVNYFVQHDEGGWRRSMAVALIPPVILACGIYALPESPRWLYLHKGEGDAAAALARLRGGDAAEELGAIRDAVKNEHADGVSYRDVLTCKRIRTRLGTAVALQMFQQLTGINPVLIYGGMIFEAAVGSGVLALLVLNGVNFAATIPGLYWVDTKGRRTLLLVGAVGMAIGIAACGVVFLLGCGGGTDRPHCTPGASAAMILAACVYIWFFAVAWGPVSWIYPAEIFPLQYRAKAVSLSTMANWSTGAVMIGAPALFPALGVHGVFFLFSGMCVAAWVFVYHCCPETRGVSLENIEKVFAGRDAWRRVDGGDWASSDEEELAPMPA